ncbi:MAG: radical SAM family heme chaperone HemW [Synergistetes bacterium]|nr:radical SAM family heme chaperone HemW [Synergistota bacterium]
MRRLLSIYIHIPFCISKCNYCSFFSIIAPNSIRKGYLQLLLKEIPSYRNIKTRVKSIYIGGGTPTIYAPSEIKKIVEACYETFKFHNDPEISIEANPITLSKDKILELKEIGITRISVGVQSLSDRILRILGRLHDSKTAIKTLKDLKEAGLKSWNVDLIYGIPTQSMEEWKKTLKGIVALSPPHLSLYSLIIEEGTYIQKMISKGILKPAEDEGFEMYKWAIGYLKSHGYEHYEISNFAKPKHRCIHNLSYWENSYYLGIGCSASSFFRGWRFTRGTNLQNYRGFSEQIRLNKKEQEKETMMMGLRLIEGVNKKRFQKRFKENIYTVFGKEISELIKVGLLEDTGKEIKLTERGIMLGNHVFERFV